MSVPTDSYRKVPPPRPARGCHYGSREQLAGIVETVEPDSLTSALGAKLVAVSLFLSCPPLRCHIKSTKADEFQKEWLLNVTSRKLVTMKRALDGHILLPMSSTSMDTSRRPRSMDLHFIVDELPRLQRLECQEYDGAERFAFRHFHFPFQLISRTVTRRISPKSLTTNRRDFKQDEGPTPSSLTCSGVKIKRS